MPTVRKQKLSLLIPRTSSHRPAFMSKYYLESRRIFDVLRLSLHRLTHSNSWQFRQLTQSTILKNHANGQPPTRPFEGKTCVQLLSIQDDHNFRGEDSEPHRQAYIVARDSHLIGIAVTPDGLALVVCSIFHLARSITWQDALTKLLVWEYPLIRRCFMFSAFYITFTIIRQWLLQDVVVSLANSFDSTDCIALLRVSWISCIRPLISSIPAIYWISPASAWTTWRSWG